MAADAETPTSRRTKIVPVVLIACVCVSAFWIVMSHRSRKPYGPLKLNKSDFESFVPSSPDWSVRVRQAESDHPSVENLLAHEITGTGPVPGPPVLVRLAHGYNMPDCMVLKGYKVELIGDTAPSADPASSVQDYAGTGRAGSGRVQLWRLTSDIGDVSVWATMLIRADNYEQADTDIRAIAFPRIAGGLDPSWTPEGLRASSLRHPVRNFTRFIKVLWSNARCDLLTFLKLKRPVWVSEDVLALVAHTSGSRIKPEDENAAVSEVLAVQAFAYGELVRWKKKGSIGSKG